MPKTQNPDATEPCVHHDWETGSWGVILGVSKCKKCGRVCQDADFDYEEEKLTRR